MNPETPQTPEQPTTPPVEPTPPVPPVENPAPAVDSAPISSTPTETPSPFANQPPVETPVPSPVPNNKKKIVLIASIVGGAILLAIVGVILYTALTAVSKQDYADASRQFNEVSSSSSQLTRTVSSLNSSVDESDETFNEDAKAAEEALATVKTENEELGKLKAVRVGEGGDLYKTFNDKLTAYLANGETLLTSMKNIHPAMIVCGNIRTATDIDARVAALKACSASLSGVSDVPNAEFKAYVDKLKTAYADYATAYEAMSKIDSPYGAGYEKYKVQRDKMYAAQDAISEASTAFRDAIEKKDDELSVKESAEALADYLNEQQRQ